MNQLRTIAFTYLKQTFASRGVLIFTIAMPMIFTIVLAFAMGGLGPDNSSRTWTLLLADEDHSPHSAALTRQLETNPALEVVALPAEDITPQVESGEAAAGLVIPAGFGAALMDGQPVQVRLYRSAQAVMDAQLLEQSIGAALAAVDGMQNSAALAGQVAAVLELPHPAAQETFQEAAHLWETAAPLEVRATPVTRLQSSKIPLGAVQSSPGMAVMYVLFLTLGGGSTLLTERENGTLRRLLVMPLRKGTLIGGKLLGIYLSALAQLTLMVLFGRFALGVNWGQSPLGLTLMLLVYAFAATALGILVAALARTSAQADGMSTLVVMALSALGGAWWPIEIVPPWMQSLAKIFPTYWGMQGFHDLISRGLGVTAILPEAGILLAFGAAFLGIGLWRFRWE